MVELMCDVHLLKTIVPNRASYRDATTTNMLVNIRELSRRIGVSANETMTALRNEIPIFFHTNNPPSFNYEFEFRHNIGICKSPSGNI